MAKNNSISHYGVKGMHWGVRRSRAELDSGTTHVTQPKPGGKLVTQGGKGIPAHADAINSARARQVAKSSGVHALSNQELQQAVTRMNLEQQYSRLSNSQKSKGAQFASSLLGNVAKQQTSKFANDLAAQQVAAALKKNKQ